MCVCLLNEENTVSERAAIYSVFKAITACPLNTPTHTHARAHILVRIGAPTLNLSAERGAQRGRD